MADLTFSWDDEVRVFGLEETNNWGTMLWGQNWGDGENIYKDIGKVIEDDVTTDDEWSQFLDLSFTFDESVSCDDALDNLEITDANGFKRVFQNTTDAVDAPMTAYSESSTTGSSYTRQTSPGTTWTEQ